METVFTSGNFENEVYESQLPVLVDFYADWCGPCKAMGPVIEALAEEYEGKAKIGKLNVDNNSDIALKYGVMSIPTFIVFKDGQAVNKMIGMQDKGVLASTLEQFI